MGSLVIAVGRRRSHAGTTSGTFVGDRGWSRLPPTELAALDGRELRLLLFAWALRSTALHLRQGSFLTSAVGRRAPAATTCSPCLLKVVERPLWWAQQTPARESCLASFGVGHLRHVSCAVRPPSPPRPGPCAAMRARCGKPPRGAIECEGRGPSRPASALPSGSRSPPAGVRVAAFEREYERPSATATARTAACGRSASARAACRPAGEPAWALAESDHPCKARRALSAATVPA